MCGGVGGGERQQCGIALECQAKQLQGIKVKGRLSGFNKFTYFNIVHPSLPRSFK